MLIVPDTAILMCWIVNSSSFPRQLLYLWEETRVQFALSAPMLQELTQVLSYPQLAHIHQHSDIQLGKLLADLRNGSHMMSGRYLVQAVNTEPAADKFLACALEAQADAVVSGDPHLLNLKWYQGIPIITAKDCVERLHQAVL